MRRSILFALLFAASIAFGQPLRWGQLPGAATDLSIAPNGDAWIVGTDPAAGGFGIYRFDGAAWVRMPGGASRISAGPQGPWIVTTDNAILRWDGKGWQKVPGAAVDIGVGADGSAWIIGTNPEPGGYGIYRWNNRSNNFDKVPGSAERIAVDSRGNAVVVNKAKEVFAWMAAGFIGQFVKLPGTALDVGTGADGSLYSIGTDHGVYQWSGNNWVKRDGTFETVGVDPKGSPWAINAKREVFAAGRGAAPAVPGDVTAKLENLGIANNARYATRIYARNPWDMKAYRGKVYIGSGNSNNEGPDTNAGPVDVTFFDPATGKFGSEWQVNDEQVDLFRIIGSALAIPGHDPRESWAKGNFYRRAGEGSWQQVRTVDYAIHMYDIIERTEAAAPSLSTVDRTGFGGQFLFAAIATPTGAEVAVSANEGRSWTSHSVVKYVGARARTFLSTPSALCLSAHTNHNVPVIPGTSAPFTSSTWLVTSKGVAPVMVDLFPGRRVPHMFAAKPAVFNGEAFYFAAYAPIDHNWKSEGLFATRDCRSARAVNVPGKWFHHALVEGSTLYVATSDEESGGRRNHVHASTDGASFKEVLNFAHKGFARSFAILNGDFYFGIGSEAEAPHPETGAILRLKAAQVPK